MESIRWISFILTVILCETASSPIQSKLKRVKRWEGTGDMSNMFRGTAGVDYPDYKSVPTTNFRCSEHEYEGGLYADVETQCQVYHVCHDGRKDSFLCGKGTVFNQQILACDYWYSTECDTAPSFYHLNSQIGNPGSSWVPPQGENSQINNQGTNSGQNYPQPHNQETNSGQYYPQPHNQETNSGQYYPQPHNQEANSGQYYPQPHNQEANSGQNYPQPHNQETNSGQNYPSSSGGGIPYNHNYPQTNSQNGNDPASYNPETNAQSGSDPGSNNPETTNYGTDGQFNTGPNPQENNLNHQNKNDENAGANQEDKSCCCLKNTYKAPWDFPVFPGK